MDAKVIYFILKVIFMENLLQKTLFHELEFVFCYLSLFLKM